MPDRVLAGLRIFVAEDEYLLALDLSDILSEAGGDVLGPARTSAEVRNFLDTKAHLDVALLDLNLGGHSATPFALELRARSVPVILTTGYESHDLPDALKSVPICLKPLSATVVIKSICTVTGRAAGTTLLN